MAIERNGAIAVVYEHTELLVAIGLDPIQTPKGTRLSIPQGALERGSETHVLDAPTRKAAGSVLKENRKPLID